MYDHRATERYDHRYDRREAYEARDGDRYGPRDSWAYGDEAASYRRALELAPGDPLVHYNYARLLLQQGRLDEDVRRHLSVACAGGLPPACAALRTGFPR